MVKMEPVLYVEFCVNAQKFPSRGFWGFCFFPRNCYKVHVLNIRRITELREEQLEREIHTNRIGNIKLQQAVLDQTLRESSQVSDLVQW